MDLTAQKKEGGVPSTSTTASPAWVPCACGEFWCRIHGMHVFECDCLPIEQWEGDPYA